MRVIRIRRIGNLYENASVAAIGNINIAYLFRKIGVYEVNTLRTYRKADALGR